MKRIGPYKELCMHASFLTHNSFRSYDLFVLSSSRSDFPQGGTIGTKHMLSSVRINWNVIKNSVTWISRNIEVYKDQLF